MTAYSYARPCKDGSTSIQVKWRDRGTGRWCSETFDGHDAARAAEFRVAVQAAGDRWPRGWVIGRGWTHELREVSTLNDVFDSWVEWQQGRVAKNLLKGHTLTRYRADYDRHIRDALGSLDFIDLSPDDVEDWLADRLAVRAA